MTTPGSAAAALLADEPRAAPHNNEVLHGEARVVAMPLVNAGGYRLQADYYEPDRVPDEVLRYSAAPTTLRVGSPGKVGVLQLGFELAGGTTQLTSHYQKSPLQIMRPLYFNLARPDMPYLYMMATGGGILQGDRLRTDITFGPDSSAHVTTQAHSKVYKMESGYASAITNLVVEAGAFVEYLPEPVIPYARSRFYQDTSVVLDPTATLLVGETVYAGRLARGERHAYDVYASDFEVRRPDGQLVALDRVRLCPDEGSFDGESPDEGSFGGAGESATDASQGRTNPATGLGVMADHDVLSMLYVFVPVGSVVLSELADLVHKTLVAQGSDDLLFGVSTLPGDTGVWMRLVGNDTIAVTRANTAVAASVHEFLTGKVAPIIRKS